MKRFSSQRHWTTILLLLCLSVFGAGCPGTTPGPTDGGVPLPDSQEKISCTTGAYCLHLKDDKIRACDILFAKPNDQTIEGIGFGDEIIGRSMQRATRAGVSFILRRDKGLPSTQAAVILKVPSSSQDQHIKWKILKASCTDAKGNPIASPALSFDKQ